MSDDSIKVPDPQRPLDGWNREWIARLGSRNLLVVMMYMCDPNIQADTGS